MKHNDLNLHNVLLKINYPCHKLFHLFNNVSKKNLVQIFNTCRITNLILKQYFQNKNYINMCTSFVELNVKIKNYDETLAFFINELFNNIKIVVENEPYTIHLMIKYYIKIKNVNKAYELMDIGTDFDKKYFINLKINYMYNIDKNKLINYYETTKIKKKIYQRIKFSSNQ